MPGRADGVFMGDTDLMKIFASKAFNDAVMREKLPAEVYDSLKQTIKDCKELDSGIAEIVADAMKDWAVENGATHYCHWFIPMTGSPAEKHNSFLNLVDTDKVILKFSGKNLIKGESDASSFPSGGLRATFEARGYTAWDCTSPAFLRNGTLCIPTVYCSYNGEALDKKTPLLRSMETLSAQSVRLLGLLGEKSSRVYPSVGAEQEYFLIDERYYGERLDLKFTGKTLFGKMPPKGQEMDDHYYGDLNKRVADFMAELDVELWKLAITSTTKHNEVAPSQHELAPIHEVASVACDRNHLTMEIMKRVAKKHGMVCLLHEKPFEGVNGSGKHNNWSLINDSGENLFKPGKKIKENLRFLLFLAAVIRSVDLYSDLLSFSISSAGNDCRLGGDEAPPRIISIFLGEGLTSVFEHFATGGIEHENPAEYFLKFGIKTAPSLRLDSTDRNRTSPFAFTGDKFEFRMPGSSASVSDCNTIINTAVGESLDYICGRLEKAADVKAEAAEILKDIYVKHKRIIFNGDGYSKEWAAEAKKRGLTAFKDTVEAAPCLISEKNSALLQKYAVFNAAELNSRYEVTLRVYNKVKNIEAKTMLDMTAKQFLPAANEYLGRLMENARNAKELGIDGGIFTAPASRLAEIVGNIQADSDLLKSALLIAYGVPYGQTLNRAKRYRDDVGAAMKKLRGSVDSLEDVLPRSIYPVPTYVELLFGND